MVQGLQQAVDAFTAAAVSLPWALTDSFMSTRAGFEPARTSRKTGVQKPGAAPNKP